MLIKTIKIKKQKIQNQLEKINIDFKKIQPLIYQVMDSIIDSLSVVVNRRIQRRIRRFKLNFLSIYQYKIRKYMFQLKIRFLVEPKSLFPYQIQILSFNSRTLRNYRLRSTDQQTKRQKIKRFKLETNSSDTLRSQIQLRETQSRKTQKFSTLFFSKPNGLPYETRLKIENSGKPYYQLPVRNDYFKSPHDSLLRTKFLRFPFENDSTNSCSTRCPRFINSDQRLIFLRALFLIIIRPITKIKQSTVDQSKILPLNISLVDPNLLSPKIFLIYLMQRQFPFNLIESPYNLRAYSIRFFLFNYQF
ncbi:unnamed protein product [Paramecium primaurelia]|uniref:Uncharacterized protein n=1 Tax=Paramecium primaurelia TaxID=5886 RepID=A0A8S1L4K1_PARPR|nr:unnamed protein product [Paramecium primaurelia]